jgi:hypothetical protein
VEQRRRLDVQILVDESKSLERTDPDGKRVKALMSVVDVLTNVVRTSQGASTPLVVNVMVAGFGSGYKVRRDFAALTESTADDLKAIIAEQAQRNSDVHTRYHVALKRAVDEFTAGNTPGSSVGGPAPCRMLLWFSDGKHDDDNNGEDDKEPGQIESLICSPDGLADDLRRNAVFVVAVGLMPSGGEARDLETMERIAQPTGRGCGSVPATGIFALADRADDLVGKILLSLNVPGTPDKPVTLEPCADRSVDCGQISFTVDEYVDSFSLLAVRPSNGVSLQVTTNSSETRTVLGTAGQSEDANAGVLTATKVTDNTALVSANSKAGSLQGIWTFTFRGTDALSSTGSVSFLGNTNVDITDAAGLDVTEVNRANPESMYVSVSAESTSAAVQAVTAQLVSGPQVLSLDTELAPDGRFLISDAVLGAALNTGAFATAAQVTLVVSPVGVVNGIRTAGGLPVEVDFAHKVALLLVNKGSQFPTFLRLGDGELQFTGTATKPLTLKFRGAEIGDSTVTFEGFDENEADFEVVSGADCLVGAQVDDAECTIDIKPGKETFGAKVLRLKVIYSDAAGATSDVAIEIPVETKKSTNAGAGIIAALVLVAVFLAVQTGVRWMLAALVTSFAALSPTARRVRIPVMVDAAGGVTVLMPSAGLSPVDEGFAFENQEKTRQFGLFGLDFSCSVWKTFTSQTDSPEGRVSSVTDHCFSTGGAVASQDTGLRSGVIPLTLRRSWALAVSDDSIRRLALDGSPAEGFLVAFLDPYEMSNRDQQINDIEVDIATGAFSGAFAALVEGLREDDGPEPPTGADGGFSSSPFDSSDPFGGPSGGVSPAPFDSSDPFGGPPGAAPTAVDDGVGRGRRGRKAEPADSATTFPESNPFGDSDPFR